MRSLARAFSSSRLAPPIQASKPYCSMVSKSVTVCKGLRLAFFPFCSMTLPWSILSCTEPTISRSPSCSTSQSLNSIVSGKLCPVSICTKGKGNLPGRKAFLARWTNVYYLSHPKIARLDFQTVLLLHAVYKSLLLPNDLNNPYLCHVLTSKSAKLSIVYLSCGMQTAFLFAFVFPPPATGSEIFAGSDGACARLTANAWKAFVV